MIDGDPSGSAVPTVSSTYTELHGTVIHRGEVAHLMPEPSLRLLPQHPWPAAPGSPRGTVLLRDRGQTDPKGASAPHGGDTSGGTEPSGPNGNGSGSGSGSEQDNPFAPPPEGSPDQPWRPRRPEGSSGDGSGGDDQGPWGNQWSDRQPGRSGGRFGERPGQQGGGQDGPPSGMRWDPADPGQRRARYALLTGMWAFFFALFSWPYVALLLGALAVYWGVSAVRGVPARGSGDAEAGGRKGSATGSGSAADAGKPPVPAAASGAAAGTGGKRPQTTAAISGIVTGGLALAIVAATFTAQLVYQDYYVCARDALTVPAEKSCEDLLPKDLRSLLGVDQ